MWRPATLILHGMLSPRSALTRWLALLTPLCMVWVFAACVSLCGEHEAARAGCADAHSVSAPGFAETQDCCPAGEASCGVPGDRAMFVSQPGVAEPPSEAVAMPTADFVLARPARGAPSDWAFDPPFKLLRTLRI
jgi:hypothetical protein